MRARAMTLRPWTLAMAIVLVAMIAGCGPMDGITPTPVATSDTISPAPVSVWADSSLAGTLGQIGAEYSAATGTSVTVTPIDPNELMAKFAALAPQGQGPDLLLADSPDVGRLVGAGLLAPVDYRTREAGFTRWSRDAFRLAGTIYGMPISGDGLALLRNTELVKKAPRSIEAMARTGQKLVSTGEAVVPIALPIGVDGDAHRWYPFYSAAGGYLYGQQTDGSFDPDDLGVGLAGSVQAGRLLAEMAEAGDIDPKLSAKKCAALFAAGRTPYLIGGLSDAAKAVAAGVAVAVTPVPGFAGIPEAASVGPVAYRGLVMSAFARNRDAAQRFLVGAIANTSAMTSLLMAQRGLPAWAESLQRAALDPLMAGFADSAESSGAAPNVANVAVAWQQLSSAQTAILAGGNPRRAMSRARAEIVNAAVSQ